MNRKHTFLALQIFAGVLCLAGLVNSSRTYDYYQSGHADLQTLLERLGMSLGPFLLAAMSSAGGFLAKFFPQRDGSTPPLADTLTLLSALKTIIDQFQAKGVPDKGSATLAWQGETYVLNWKKQVKEPTT